LVSDPQFATDQLRSKNRAALNAAIAEKIRTRSSREWIDILNAAGVPCGPVLTRNQVIRHPQVAALGLVVETGHEAAGRLRQARAAARFSRTPPEIRHGAPALGEHTREILAELGYSAREIAELSPEKVR